MMLVISFEMLRYDLRCTVLFFHTRNVINRRNLSLVTDSSDVIVVLDNHGLPTTVILHRENSG